MAILHFVIGGPRKDSTSVSRVEYIAAERPHFTRGGVELVESGNLPAFATNSAQTFWEMLDRHERVNARLFTEIELALPHELTWPLNQALARKAVQAFTGTSFPYTMAVHLLLDGFGREQRHLHLVLCERPVNSETRMLPADTFFTRKGAKKDLAWNKRSKPIELRALWCRIMNEALASAGLDARVDARPRQDGRPVEPKILTRAGRVNQDAIARTKIMRTERDTLASAIGQVEEETRRKIAAIEFHAAAQLEQLTSAESEGEIA